MKAIFTDFPMDSNWVSGIIEGTEFKFESKLFDEGSRFGIDGGRVSKLSIRNKNVEGLGFFDGYIVNYDRGWDIEPKDEQHIKIFNEVMNLLENSPIRFLNK